MYENYLIKEVMMVLSVISFFGVIFYIFFAMHILKNDEKSEIVRVFAGACISLAIWSLGYVFMFASQSKEVYYTWYKFSSIGWLYFPVIIYHFIIKLTKNEKLKRYKYIILYLIPLPLIYRVFYKTLLTVDYIKEEQWYEIMDTSSLWFWVYIFYAGIFMILGIIKVIRWKMKTKRKREKKQADLLLFSFPLAFISAVILNIILPAFLKLHHSPLSHIYLVIWVSFVWYSMAKYHFIFFDITELVNSVVEESIDVMVLTDLDLNIKEINLNARKYLGMEKEEVIGLGLESVLKFNSINEKLSLDRIIKIGAGRVVMEFYKSENESVPVELVFRTVKDNLEEAVGVLVLGQDISNMKKLEKEVLERKIVEKNLKKALAEVEEAQEKLVSTEKLASAGRLAGGLAHELNSPLGAILSSAQYIKEVLGKKSEDLNDSIEIIEEGVYKSQKIISELLRYSNSSKRWVSRMNFAEIIYDSLALFEENMEKELIGIKLEIEPQVFIYGNSLEIMQVINSILSNSREALLELNVDKQISIELYKRDDKAYLEITDNGIGMEKETLERAFEPFFSNHKIKNKLGLGLSTAYDIVKKHKGDIIMESRIGDGTKLKLIFNLEPEYSIVNKKKKYI